eukprot:4302211-Ditylum_brightwellii.AAC.1
MVVTIVVTIVMMAVTSTLHISQEGFIVVSWKKEANMQVAGNRDTIVDNSGDNSDDGGDKHLTHLSQGVDC